MFFIFSLFFNFIFKLYIIVLVLPNIKMNTPQVYMCSPFWTLLPPPSPYHPSGLSQCTSPKHPVSCIKPGLATRFIHDILHVSMPFSQIFPVTYSLYFLLFYSIFWAFLFHFIFSLGPSLIDLSLSYFQIALFSFIWLHPSDVGNCSQC